MIDYGATYYPCQPDFELDPDSTDDFEFNMTEELGDDTISSFSFVLPDGLTVVSSTSTATTVTPFLTGATCGAVYRVICRYVTTGGRTRDKTIRIIGREQ